MAAADCHILFVGRRNGATRAARGCGLSYTVVQPDEVDQISETGLPPDLAAVVALTEAAVLPAAKLSARLSLSGISVETAVRCTSKRAMKEAIAATGIPCARLVVVNGAIDADELIDQLGLPLVLKTDTGSGSRGARVINTAAELPASVSVPSVAESFVDGVEMSVESVVRDGQPVFVNLTEYVEPKWANLLPARLDEEIAEKVRAMNVAAIRALGIERGFTHMEVFLTEAGPVFGELAARPPGGHIMQLIALAYDFDPWAAMLAVELGESPPVKTAPQQTAAMRFLHPGAGTVRSVSGMDKVRQLPTCKELVCRVQPGDVVPAREGTGQHCGFVILAGGESQVRSDLHTAGDCIRIELEPTAGT